MEPTPTSHTTPYIERFGISLDKGTVNVLLATAILFISGVVMISLHSISWPIMFLLFFSLAWSWVVLRIGGFRRIALRVDQDGIAFGVGPYPLGRRKQQLPTVPWHDLRQIALWDYYPNEGLIRQAWIGLAFQPGAAPPPALTAPRIRIPHIPIPKRLRPSSTWPPPHVPAELISTRIVDWRLDRARLLQAVTAYAPDVEVVEVQQNGSVLPLTTSPPRLP